MSNRNSGIFQMQLPRVHIREALDHFKSICGRDHKGSAEGSTFMACREAVGRYVQVPHQLVGAYCYQTPSREYDSWNDQTGTELPAGSAASWGKFRQWDGAAGELLP